ncbi:MAG: cell division protein FtsA [Alphaproteobacteria bacterium]|nr:cell division protein FtsA [Alphaproteobacteria bacterium SS10]
MGFTSIRHNRRRPAGSLITALDVGSTKICCFMARVEEAGHLRIVGIGHHAAAGVKAGAVVDMEAASVAISHAVHQAERMAGQAIETVLVNLSGPHARSHRAEIDITVPGEQVTEAEVYRAIGQAQAVDLGEDQDLVHAMPVGYSLDGQAGIEDPLGMYGKRLGVHLHLVSGATGPMRNLSACIERSELNVEAFCLGSYAAGLASLTEDEMRLGVTLVDIGGGTTDIAVFSDMGTVHTDCLPVGGSHVTNDLARGLGTAVGHAERIKTLFGSALPASGDDQELIDVPLLGDDQDGGGQHQVPRSIVVGIMRPRLEEIFELVRLRLERAGADQIGGRRVVLTGGSSQITGIRELAGVMMDKQVRLGRPNRLLGLAPATTGPGFATTAGLLHYGLEHRIETIPEMTAVATETPWYQRVGSWLKENL